MAKPSEAIREIAGVEGRSLRSLALDLGITPQALGNRLSGDMKTSTLCEIASLLGYKVMLVPSESETEGYTVECSSD